jgi:hypothetical protein
MSNAFHRLSTSGVGQNAISVSERIRREQLPIDEGKRWLNREDTAAYVGVRVDQLTRHVRSGKLPAPNYHLGPGTPRWDRLALDAAFEGDAAKQSHGEDSYEQTVADILAGEYSRKPSLAERERRHAEKLRKEAAEKRER